MQFVGPLLAALCLMLALCSLPVTAKKTAKVYRVEYSGKEQDMAALYASQGKAVVITNSAVKHWKVAKWTLQSLADNAMPDIQLACKNSTSPHFSWGCCHVYPMTVQQLVASILQPPVDPPSPKPKPAAATPPAATTTAPAAAPDAAAASAAAASSTASPTAETTTPPPPPTYVYFAGPPSLLGDLEKDLDNIDILNVKEAQKDEFQFMEQEVRSTIWLGSKKATTPLHHDLMHNFFYQVHGEKRFLLFPPIEWKNVYLYPKFHILHRNSQLNLSDPEAVRKYPNYRKASPIIVDMKPGDLLYLPPLWFHQVEALTPSISLNVWSASRVVETINNAWTVDVPIQFKLWPPYQVITMMKLYALILAREVLGYDAAKAREYFGNVAHSRYEHLFGPHSTGFEHHVYDSIVMDSPEGKQYEEWLNRSSSIPAFLYEADNTDFVPDDDEDEEETEGKKDAPKKAKKPQGRRLTREEVLAQEKAELESVPTNLRWRYRSKKRHKNYHRYRDLYLKYCPENEVQMYIRQEPNLEQEMVDAATQVARAFHVARSHAHQFDIRGIMEIYLSNYIEDLVAQAVGEEYVYSYISNCINNPY